jgi:hypothetical protein
VLRFLGLVRVLESPDRIERLGRQCVRAYHPPWPDNLAAHGR